MSRPRITPLQRDILTKLADGWDLCSDGIDTCWIEYTAGPGVSTVQDVPLRTAERLVLRGFVKSNGWLLPAAWQAIGREMPL